MRANIPTEGWIGGPGTEMAILNRNPESPTLNQPARRPIVFVYELKHDLNLYLRDWADRDRRCAASPTSSRSTRAHADRALRFGQDIFLAAEATRGDLCELEYRAARQTDLRAARTLGLDAYMDGTGSTRCCSPAPPAPRSPPRPAIRAFRCRPALSAGSRDQETPDYPFGATFTGRAWSEPTLLRLAYAFEQATRASLRRPACRLSN